MKSLDLSRCALCSCAAAALFAWCGGSQTMNTANETPSAIDPLLLPHHRTFYYTGTKQSFKVPAGVASITVVALGAAGGSYGHGHGGGRGGRVFAVVPVLPEERLEIFAGGTTTDANGGYNGGGQGFYGSSMSYSYGGGGATDIRDGNELADRVLVAGGGGGHGGIFDPTTYGRGGRGGGDTAGNGFAGDGQGVKGLAGGGGRGGTQHHGGRGGQAGSGGYGDGLPGTKGVLGAGGSGGFGAGSAGGGGGGGYYGGGGGGGGGWAYGDYDGWGGGGGGGSSYVTPIASHVEFWRGWAEASGNGVVVLGWR
jgi:hypothetical protein